MNPFRPPAGTGPEDRKRLMIIAAGACASIVFVSVAIFGFVQPNQQPAGVDGQLNAGSAELDPAPQATPTPEATKPETSKPAPAPPAPTTGDFTGWSDEEITVLKLTNVERAKYNCPALKPQSQLHTAARDHSVFMAKVGQMAHDGIGDGDPFQRMTNAGYRYSAAAENVAAGQRSAKEVVQAWINSPGHHENMVNCAYTELGVGLGKAPSASDPYQLYWTQNFGAR